MLIETERVVAGILVIGNMFFVAKPIHAEHDRNQWAFPAGKLVGDEDPRTALVQVLKNKLNLSATVGKQLGVFRNTVGTKLTELDCYWVDGFTGELTLSTYCACSWLVKESLSVVELESPHDLVRQALFV
jgi:8-oxo-dGTP pyrophosphatase MutT (NUDIX family)